MRFNKKRMFGVVGVLIVVFISGMWAEQYLLFRDQAVIYNPAASSPQSKFSFLGFCGREFSEGLGFSKSISSYNDSYLQKQISLIIIGQLKVTCK